MKGPMHPALDVAVREKNVHFQLRDQLTQETCQVIPKRSLNVFASYSVIFPTSLRHSRTEEIQYLKTSVLLGKILSHVLGYYGRSAAGEER
jgi:hypothetical protein